jgi:UDP-N-acetylglucosamine 2-epimerase (non-hydrolysing)
LDVSGASVRPDSITVAPMTDLLIVVGARPNFMKATSLVHAAGQRNLTCTLLHTGQHYDDDLSRVFFDELGLPVPDIYLGVGSGSHATQTARIMLGFESELLARKPAVVLVVGDVNSTLACALVAAKEHYPVGHVEAGLRSFDERMPEEINRRLCDHLSTYLFTTAREADENLRREGIADERVQFVGNTMIDTLLRFRDRARAREAPERFGLERGGYAVVTLHRPENVDEYESLSGLVEALLVVGRCMPLVFPVHPRTKERLARHGLDRALEAEPGVHVSAPVGYLDFVGLCADARLVVTDSGGVQEETTVLGVPCITVRDSTERPVTVQEGTNKVVGSSPERVVEEALTILEGPNRPIRIPELWDGRAGERIVEHLERALNGGLATASALA